MKVLEIATIFLTTGAALVIAGCSCMVFLGNNGYAPQFKHCFAYEKKSRKRTEKVLSDKSMSAFEKCQFLDNELKLVESRFFVSQDWKDYLSNKAAEIMEQNALTVKDFL